MQLKKSAYYFTVVFLKVSFLFQLPWGNLVKSDMLIHSRAMIQSRAMTQSRFAKIKLNET